MGKSTGFEGELDRGGNPTCGESFMAGTICSLAPGHDGSCGSICQVCGQDWYMMDGCECSAGERCAEPGCDQRVEDTDLDAWCDDHICSLPCDDDPSWYCNGHAGHAEKWHRNKNRRTLEPPAQEELAEVYRILGGTPTQ